MKPVTVARDLQRRRARERTGLFTAEGVRCVEELLASPLVIKSVVVSPALLDTERGTRLDSSIRDTAIDRGIQLTEVTDSDLASAAGTETPQGIIAIAALPERSFEPPGTTGIFLLMDGVQDPGNVGTILRTAQAFGVSATIALPGTVDLWNPKVVRSAMGALFSQHAFHASVAESMEFMRANQVPVWTTAMTGESVSGARAGGSLAIVVGNEGNGVSEELRLAAERTVAIPISGVESLNVAVATGIILYAVTRE